MSHASLVDNLARCPVPALVLQASADCDIYYADARAIFAAAAATDKMLVTIDGATHWLTARRGWQGAAPRQRLQQVLHNWLDERFHVDPAHRGRAMDEVITQFEKNATEVVRVSLTEYRGHKLIDVRVYYSDDEGQYRPTKKGVSLAVGLYAEFKRAMLVLEKALLEHNLITQADLEEESVVETEQE